MNKCLIFFVNSIRILKGIYITNLLKTDTGPVTIKNHGSILYEVWKNKEQKQLSPS